MGQCEMKTIVEEVSISINSSQKKNKYSFGNVISFYIFLFQQDTSTNMMDHANQSDRRKKNKLAQDYSNPLG